MKYFYFSITFIAATAIGFVCLLILLEAQKYEFTMKRALVLFALLLPLFTPPAFGGVPELNVKAVCEARSDDAKMLQSPPDQSNADCMRDEEAAKQQLAILWASTPVSVRKQCESDARSLHMTSYNDLFACLQIAVDTKPSPKKQTGKQ